LRAAPPLPFPLVVDGFKSADTFWLRLRAACIGAAEARHPQTNGIVERFHKTVLNEFYRVAFRKKIYRSIEELQEDLDAYLVEYNETRPHQGRWCFGRTPMQTFEESLPLAEEKMLAA